MRTRNTQLLHQAQLLIHPSQHRLRDLVIMEYGTTIAAREMRKQDRRIDILREIAELITANEPNPETKVRMLVALNSLDRRSGG